MKDYSKYKKGWDRREAKEKKEAEKERKEALRSAKYVSEILAKQFNVNKVILFGSALQPGYFTRHSDIDIAVAGLEKTRYFEALGELMLKCDRAIDLKPIEDATPLLQEKISSGKVLYEKRKNT